MGEGNNIKLYDFTNVPNAKFICNLITFPEIKFDSTKVSPWLLNLICKGHLQVVLVMLLCTCMIYTKFVIYKISRMLKMILQNLSYSPGEDVAMHLHDLCEIYDKQNFKNIENDIAELKLFSFFFTW
jgi:hypothetical protein